ncbi:crt homolog 2-like [Acropora muricata]|uniref:crt homolog 2-like n=1 Tax=Acropora muricata TaxID=159855 RepID=UPI0034E53B63
MDKITASESCVSHLAKYSFDVPLGMDSNKKLKRLRIGFCKVPIFWANFFFATVVLAADVAQAVSLPLWLDSANGTGQVARIGSFFIMSFSCLSLIFIFGLGTMLIKIFAPENLGEAEKNFPHLLLLFIGLSDALYWVMTGYAGRGYRTPPYLQAILGNFLIPLTIILRIVVLHKRPTRLKLFCGLGVFFGLFICLIPTIFPKFNDQASLDDGVQLDNTSRVIWPLIFMFGSLPLASMNVLQERGVKMENSSEEQVNIVFFLFWTSTYEFLSILLLSWVDILPWFGDSEISTFANNWWTGLQCMFGGVGCGSAPGVSGLINMLAHIVSHLGSANLLRHAEGATWLAIVVSLVTPLGFLFWTLFSESPFMWHPECHVSTWFSIGALFIMVPATFIYNMGGPEITEDPNGANSERREIYISANSVILQCRSSSSVYDVEQPLLHNSDRHGISYDAVNITD